jgi:phage gpG-like protein
MDDARNLDRILAGQVEKITREITDRLPRKVGIVAVNHFKNNFREAGFVDGGVHPWAVTRRQMSGGKDAASKYTPLTSGRNHLMNSLQYTAGPAQVTVSDPLPYASIHNEGGTITSHPTITPKMRRMAWAKCYSLAGVKKGGKGGKKNKLPKELPPEAAKWRALALTKKNKLNITAHIPRRRFVGDSAELNGKINQIITDTIKRITNGGNT